MVIIEATQIQKTYFDTTHKLTVLKNVKIKIAQGEVVSIVGPSGAGKSTLLHILGGLDAPSEGSVMFEGEDLYHLNDHQRAKIRNEKAGFVFQFYHLLPEFTALENVMLPAFIRGGRSQSVVEKRAKNLLKQVGLTERLLHKPYQLSGGEQQRVAIARALINEPKVVFCDEPTGNLDSATGKEIVSLLMDLNKKNNQTLVLVTHDEEIAGLSHRVIYLKDGQIIKEK